MKTITFACCALLLVACQREPTDTVESLVANPKRLAELRDQCRVEREKVNDAICRRVAEATKLRFFGDGKVPYTPSKDGPKFYSQ